MTKHRFLLEGLDCSFCAGKIEAALRSNEHYDNLSLNFASKALIFQSTESCAVLLEEVQGIVDEIEDGVSVQAGCGHALDGRNQEHAHAHEHEHLHLHELKAADRPWYRLYAKELLGVLLFIAAYFDFGRADINLVLFLLSYLLIGFDVLRDTLRRIRRGKFMDELFLMSVATIGALALGEYKEAVFVMLFYKAGQLMEGLAVGRSRADIAKMIDLKADTAELLVDGKTQTVATATLQPGDLILVKAGAKVPVDAVVVFGSSEIDMSSLNGESKLRAVGPGDEVLSACTNRYAALQLRVVKPLSESTVTKLLDLIEQAAALKAPKEQFITRFAKYYTPVVVFLALGLAFLPPLLGYGSVSSWLSRALILLVISCPCALVISVPLSYFAAIGRISREGVLVKGGQVLDELVGINGFAFDKTGTLTKGQYVVRKVVGEETLRLAALVEQFSTHPIARSILAAYEQDPGVADLLNVFEHAGRGISAELRGERILVGSESLMREQGVAVAEEYTATVLAGSGLSRVYVAKAGQLCGYLDIGDELKPGMANFIASLRRDFGGRIYMLTGDEAQVAGDVAAALQLDGFEAGLMPGDKLDRVLGYKAEGTKLLFMGDGLNDAPVLMAADVGVAMGGLGSDAAIESADMVIIDDKPEKLLPALRIAKRTSRIVVLNIALAIGVKLSVLLLAAAGLVGMPAGIVADVGVTLVCVANSLLILRD